jgi:hypothetical protein
MLCFGWLLLCSWRENTQMEKEEEKNVYSYRINSGEFISQTHTDREREREEIN